MLGGGLVAGSVTLLGGDPGIGKSTLWLQAAAALAPTVPVLIVDSIQTMAAETAPGSVSQLRESATQFVRFAKTTGNAVVLIDHVIKEGLIAGPRVLERLVDTVLYLESHAGSRLRIVRAINNGFGAAQEIGVLAME